MVLALGFSSPLAYSGSLLAAEQAGNNSPAASANNTTSNKSSTQVSGDFLSYLAELVEVDGKLVHPTELNKEALKSELLKQAQAGAEKQPSTQSNKPKEQKLSGNKLDSSEGEQ
ncbi:hypothetical protein DXX93_03685 [Thalassotalea euphylliae]|uniref:Uncharacterized protein n=1 Tax=Thalassotalea euphylliae TaxID=1655234 RepID=A0A3E0TMW2_9GAMM|nr:hypothetical protein [Thalassotalea euphylliae]REL25743.1 hypothetical protein DXX93_03685 [Thalassotalea euphylliae]